MSGRKGTIDAILGPAPGAPDGAGGGVPDSLQACAEELIEAVHAKDSAGVVSALQALFQAFDSEPHEEGPHTGE